MATGIGNGIGIYPPELAEAREGDAEFVVTTPNEGKIIVNGYRFSIDGQLLIITDRQGKQIAAFNHWSGVRVKEAT